MKLAETLFKRLPKWNSWTSLPSKLQRDVNRIADSASKQLRHERKRYENYAAKYGQQLDRGLDSVKARTWSFAKHHLLQTPIYGYKVVKIGSYYGFQLIKVFRKTRAGKLVQLGIFAYVTGRAGYVYGTTFTREVMVVKSFQRFGEEESDGINGYMFSDEQNRIYRATNSPWFLQFYSTEMWADIRERQLYRVTGYGLRFAALRIYPNVVWMVPIDEKEKREKKDRAHLGRLRKLFERS